MILVSLFQTIARRAKADFCVLAILALAMTILPGAAEAQEATPDRNAPIKTDRTGVERLVDDQPVVIDDLGRVPLVRATFARGAELPPAFGTPERDDPTPFFMEDLLILVERGEFTFTTEGETTTAGEGDQIELAATDDLSIRNDGETDGSLLILRTAFEAPDRVPFGGAALDAVAPDGVGFFQISDELDLTSVLAEVLLSLDRITLQPGDEIASLDFGGSTAPTRFILRVDSGAVAGPNGATDEEPLTADTEQGLEPDEAADMTMPAVGTEPAVVLVIRIADVE